MIISPSYRNKLATPVEKVQIQTQDNNMRLHKSLSFSFKTSFIKFFLSAHSLKCTYTYELMCTHAYAYMPMYPLDP